MPNAFYLPLGEGRFASTEHTSGPWDERFQHGGPPSALLTRALEAESPAWPATLARVSIDILGPVPVAELTVSSRVLRPGRTVDLVQAELVAGGRVVVRGQAWRVRAAELELPAYDDTRADAGAHVDDVPPFPSEEASIPAGWVGGYLHAIEWRAAAGAWAAPGPATIWGRMRHPLLPDEEPAGLQRVMTVADSGSGVSSVLPWGSWLFINPELTVHVAGPPTGEWICVDAATTVDASGFGLASSRLFDRHRLVARGAQSLLVGPR